MADKREGATPRPWKMASELKDKPCEVGTVGYGTLGRAHILGNVCRPVGLVACRYKPTAKVDSDDFPGRDEALANAALIVRAVKIGRAHV